MRRPHEDLFCNCDGCVSHDVEADNVTISDGLKAMWDHFTLSPAEAFMPEEDAVQLLRCAGKTEEEIAEYVRKLNEVER